MASSSFKASSTRSVGLLCAPRWSHWQSARARTMTAVVSGAWQTRLSTSRCTCSTPAWCRSGRTCRSRHRWRSLVYLKRRRRRWSSRCRSHRKRLSGWRAIAASLGSCSTPSPWSSTLAARSGWCRLRKARRSGFATVAARGRVATGRQPGLRRTTSCTGFMVGRPTFRTWSFSATGITGWCMRATGRSSGAMMGASTPFLASPPRGEVPRSGGGEARADRIKRRPTDVDRRRYEHNAE
jgi:hypothetical protein